MRKKLARVLAGNGRKSREKLIQGPPIRQIIKQQADGDSGLPEHRLASHDIRMHGHGQLLFPGCRVSAHRGDCTLLRGPSPRIYAAPRAFF